MSEMLERGLSRPETGPLQHGRELAARDHLTQQAQSRESGQDGARPGQVQARADRHAARPAKQAGQAASTASQPRQAGSPGRQPRAGSPPGSPPGSQEASDHPIVVGVKSRKGSGDFCLTSASVRQLLGIVMVFTDLSGVHSVAL